MDRPLEISFFSKVAQDGDCWVWTAALNAAGYGRFAHAPGTTKNCGAHRWAYEFMVGPIPTGLVLDHLCQTPACVNPYHLDPVTRTVNNNRARDRRPTCSRGHANVPENTRLNCQGSRACRLCLNENNQRQKRTRAQQLKRT